MKPRHVMKFDVEGKRGARENEAGMKKGAPSAPFVTSSREYCEEQLLLLHHFRVDRDRNVVADNHAAVVHRRIPLHAVVLTIDLGGCVDRGALIPPGILHRRRWTIDIEHNGFSRATNREIASDFEFA